MALLLLASFPSRLFSEHLLEWTEEGVSDIIPGKVLALALELHSLPPLALNFSIQGQLVVILGFVATMASVTTTHCSGKAFIDNM